jgi:agarase
LKSLHGTKNYWRLGEDSAGAWWFVSPTGDLEFLNAVTTVQPYQQGRDPDGPQFVSRDWIDPATGKPNLDRWAKLTLARVRAMGFKALGAWSNPVFHQFDIPMTRDLNIWTWVPPLHKRLYDPQWSSLVDAAVGAQAKPLRENRNLIGYFLDNELDWGDASSGPGVYFDGLPTGDPNRAQVLKVIHKLWPNVAAFNNDWETTFKTWAELEKSPTLPRTTGIGYRKLAGPWLEHLASDYFHITTAAVRKYDPNHLILGVRFKGYAPPEVCRASKGLTDAQSLNYYVNDALLDYDMFSSMHEESGQPILLSEYSFHALDGRSGNRNVVGFAAQVLDQQARADGYRMFTTSLARVPYVIGADWFQWSDEPPSGRTLDGEDVNFGMVDVDDRPYELLTSTVRQVASTLNALHAASPTDDEQGVWRESFANKPVMRVPYLSKPITLNGELSDWMPAAKMQGIRHSQTVGLERSHLPLPNVYLAWSEAGLYVGLEVFDNDILGAPAKGWWWTRDHVELFINTRPAPADQTEYDAFSHQFFFVPIDFPGADGATGIVGQWHRNGDALIDNLVPHPLVREATRVLNDRYVTEMFIPAKALHGFDPTHQPTMAFNIFVSNFQHATSYFWSAPKEVQTQMRPNTWGTLKLDPPPAGAKAIIRPALEQSAMLPLQ